MSDEISILTKADPYVSELGFAGVRLEDALTHLARATKDIPADSELARRTGIARTNIETARLWILDALEHYERSLEESANADSLDDDAPKS